MIDLGLWITVVALALFAAKLTIPKPPRLDWEQFFSVTLATLVRGSLEKNKGEFSDWVSRMSALLGVDETSGLFDDPVQLGDEYNVEHALGRPCDWEKVAAWSDEVSEAIALRVDELLWVYIGEPCLLKGIRASLPSLKIIEPDDALAANLEASLRAASDRLVVLAEGGAVEAVAKALHGAPLLRDRVKAVVAANGQFSDWFEENFTHEAMDTELARSTPWFAMGINGDQVTDESQLKWPEPAIPDSGRRSIESIALGSITVEPRTSDLDLTAKALLITLLHRFAL